MPTFSYKAVISPSGNEVNGKIDASDPVDAVQKVRALGVYPTFVREVTEGSSNSSISELDRCLCEAVWDQKADIVLQLIGSSTNVNCTEESGNTPLHLAVERLDIDIAKILLSNGADPNKRTEGNGWTPLIHAVDIVYVAASERRKNPDNRMICLLLEKGADPNLKYEGMTALDRVLKYGNNHEAVTLLQLAMRNGH